jgi:hypothetical protein
LDYFNRHLHADVVSLLDASSVLEVTEFRFFELAFHDWHGRKADEALIEKHFAAYMFANRIPNWVRHFARKILKLDAQGKLDPKNFGVWRRLPSARMMLIAKLYTATLLAVFFLLTAFVYTIPEEILTVFRQCYFPPCY